MSATIKETVNIPRETTQRAMLAVQQAQLIATGATPAIDHYFNSCVLAAKSVAEVDALFCKWWCLVKESASTEPTNVELLERWFGTVLDDTRVHGVKMPLFSTSETAIGELTEDSVGLTCTPSTEDTAGQDDFAYLPQFWCLEVSAEKNADGSHDIYAVEHIDDIETVRSGEHLCWVLQKNTYTHEWQDSQYHYFRMRCHEAIGYTQWPQGTDRTGKTYAYIANPKYFAGLDADGLITCGTGLAPVNYTSHNSLVALWRARGAQYSGASGNLLKWQIAMIWLKYARKSNSGTIDGCCSYNYQYAAAVAETGVERILLTPAQAANLYEGSNVIVGNKGDGTSADRGVVSMYSICKNKRIKSIESVTVDGTTYSAVNIDNGGEVFDTEAGATYISTMPYYSGWNDTVQGFDGSRYNPTSGKEPGLIQKTEFMNGAYLIVSDEYLQWGQDDDGNYTLDIYTCHDQSKVTTNNALSSDYTKQDDLTLTLPSTQANTNMWIEDIAVGKDKSVLWPKSLSTKAGSGTGCKASVWISPATSGLRASWCCRYLIDYSNAGLPARLSNYWTSSSYWYGGGGSPGLAG